MWVRGSSATGFCAAAPVSNSNDEASANAIRRFIWSCSLLPNFAKISTKQSDKSTPGTLAWHFIPWRAAKSAQYLGKVNSPVSVPTRDMNVICAMRHRLHQFSYSLRHGQQVVRRSRKKACGAKRLHPICMAMIHHHQVSALRRHFAVRENSGRDHRLRLCHAIEDRRQLQIPEMSVVR